MEETNECILVKSLANDIKMCQRYFNDNSQCYIFISCIKDGKVYLEKHLNEATEKTRRLCVKFLVLKGDKDKLSLFPEAEIFEALAFHDLDYIKSLDLISSYASDACDFNFEEYFDWIFNYCRDSIVEVVINLIKNKKYEKAKYILEIHIGDKESVLMLASIFNEGEVIDWLIENVEELKIYGTVEGLQNLSKKPIKEPFKYLINKFSEDDIIKASYSSLVDENSLEIFDILVDSKKLSYDNIYCISLLVGKQDTIKF